MGVEVVLVDRREGEFAACDIRVVTLKGMRFSKGSKCRKNESGCGTCVALLRGGGSGAVGFRFRFWLLG